MAESSFPANPLHHPRVTLDQWRVLHAVVEYGGFAQAAARLHRSQSAVSYAIARLQDQLGTTVLKIEGRKAQLTITGHALLQRSRQLLHMAAELESFASSMAKGREAEVRFVVDAAFPNDLLMEALSRFSKISAGTRVQLQEVILSGASDALLDNTAELVIGTELPSGFLADPLIEIEFLAVAHRDHPLHQLGRPVTSEDLHHHMHVVIRDSGHHQRKDVGWLSEQQRWTVSSIDSALNAVEHGMGFGWLPTHRLINDLSQGVLKPLPMEQGHTYKTFLFMSYGHPEDLGPATKDLAETIKQTVHEYLHTM